MWLKSIRGSCRYLQTWLNSRNMSNSSVISTAQLVAHKNDLFSAEQKRQLEEVGRVEKITVEVEGPPEDVTLIMNQNLSTPYECCRHVSQALCQQAALALINNTILWDMHRPLPGNCKIKFLKFKDEDPFSLNTVFWRTGSFVLGAVITRAFKEEINVKLFSFPPPFVKSGSFVYDVIMNIRSWKPCQEELKILSAEFLTFVLQNHKIERLRVKKHLALDIFEDNKYKQDQILKIAAKDEEHLVTLYRVADHIDISVGPMVADTSFFGRCSVTAVHKLENSCGHFYRFQGVALPKGILLNQYAYNLLLEKGSMLNEATWPGTPEKIKEIEKYSQKNSDTPIPSEPLSSTIKAI